MLLISYVFLCFPMATPQGGKNYPVHRQTVELCNTGLNYCQGSALFLLFQELIGLFNIHIFVDQTMNCGK